MEKFPTFLAVFNPPSSPTIGKERTMNKVIRLALLAATMSLLSGCTIHVWRTGQDDYEFRAPVGNSPYSFGGTVSWQHIGSGYTSSGSAPAVGGGAPTIAVPATPAPGPAPASPAKASGSPAPAARNR